MRSVSTGLLDKIDSNFDMYVGEPKVLAQVVFDHLLRVEPPGVKDLQQKLRQFGLTLLSGQGLSAFLPQGAPAYTYYARMLNGQTHGVLVKDGRPQEFLVDVGVPSLPLSCLAKAVCHNGTILNLTTKIGRPVPYLIIVEDEKKLNSDLAAVEARGLKNVYYTTPQRLDASTTLPEALFQIDQLGRIFHFSNYALKEPVYEQTLKTITVT